MSLLAIRVQWPGIEKSLESSCLFALTFRKVAPSKWKQSLRYRQREPENKGHWRKSFHRTHILVRNFTRRFSKCVRVSYRTVRLNGSQYDLSRVVGRTYESLVVEYSPWTRLEDPRAESSRLASSLIITLWMHDTPFRLRSGASCSAAWMCQCKCEIRGIDPLIADK